MVYEGPSLLVYKWAPVLIQSSRWKLDEMREDAVGRGVTSPDERMVRERCLGRGVEVPDLAVWKDFLQFQASTVRGKIEERRTDESLNSFAEWFLAGFTPVIGTVVDETEESVQRELATNS